MGQRANAWFPFVIAVVLPPAGILIGLATMQSDRDSGLRITVVAVLAAALWVVAVLSLG